VNFVVEFLEQVIERLRLGGRVACLGFECVETSPPLLLGLGQSPGIIVLNLSDHRRQHALDVVGGFSIINKVIFVGVHFELRVVSFIVETDPLALFQKFEALKTILLFLAHLFSQRLGSQLDVLDSLVYLALVLFSGFFADFLDLFFKLGILLLQHRGLLFANLVQVFNGLNRIFIGHERFDGYKFSEFQILDEVLGVLVDVEGEEVRQEDVLCAAHLLDHLTLVVLLLGRLRLVLEVHLHEGELADGRVGGTQRPGDLQLVDDRLHLSSCLFFVGR